MGSHADSLRSRRRAWRILLVSFGVIILVGAISFGVYAAATHWAEPQRLLVVGDGGPLPLAEDGSITATSPDGQPVLLTGQKADLYVQIQRVRQGLATGELVYDRPGADIMRELGSRLHAELDAAGPEGVLEMTHPDEEPSFMPAFEERFITSFLETLFPDPESLLNWCEEPLFDVDVTVYLVMDAVDQQANALEAEVAAMPEVASADLVTKEEALARMKEWFTDNPEILSNMTGNPFPASLEIRLKDPDSASSFAGRFKDRSEVGEVISASERDFPSLDFRRSTLDLCFVPKD